MNCSLSLWLRLLCWLMHILVITPLPAGSQLNNFFKPILFMASDSSSEFQQGYHSFLYSHTNTTERVREKKTNEQLWTWVSSKRKKGSFVASCILHASVDYRRRVFCAKLLQKTTRITNYFLPLLLTVLPLDSIVDSLSPSSFVNCPCVFSCTFLSSSTSGLVADLELKPFVWVSRQNRQRDHLTGAHTHTQHNGNIVSHS